MSKYRKTYHTITPSGAHLISQNNLERLQQDDPCWDNKRIWITHELAIEPRNPDELTIRYKETTIENIKQWHRHDKQEISE